MRLRNVFTKTEQEHNFVENDSALDDEDKTDTSSHQLSDDEGENQVHYK